MPRTFSWEQLGIMVLLAAALLGLYAWRERPAAGPAGPFAAPVFVEVRGEGAARPGVYAYDHPPTLRQALEEAGCPATALPHNPTLGSGSLVEVDGNGRSHVGRMSGPRLLALGLPLDLNQAAAADLERLPGLGPELARRIVEYRQRHGIFKSLAELEQVKGIGSQKLARLRPHLTVETPPAGPAHSPGRP